MGREVINLAVSECGGDGCCGVKRSGGEGGKEGGNPLTRQICFIISLGIGRRAGREKVVFEGARLGRKGKEGRKGREFSMGYGMEGNLKEIGSGKKIFHNGRKY